MGFLLRWSRRGLVLVGLPLGFVVVGVLLFEASGGLERLARGELVRLFASEPELTVELRGVTVDWLTPAIHLEGLHLHGAGGEVLLEEARCVFDLSHGGGKTGRLVALDIERGRVVLSQAFTEATTRALGRAQELYGGAPEVPDQKPSFEAPERGLPICSLTDIEVALQLPTGERVELGAGNARLEDEGESGLSLAGTIALATEGRTSQPLFFRSTLAPGGQLRILAATRNLRLKSRGSNLRSLLPPALQQVDLDLSASVDFEGVMATDGSTPPRTNARVRLENGYLRPGPGLPALEELEVDGSVSWSPEEGPLSAAALWRAAAGDGRFTARLVGEALSGAVRLPRGGQLELSLVGPGMTLDERRLAALGLPADGPVRSNWRAFDFTGRADVALGLRLDLTRESDPLRGLDVCLDASSAGQSSFRYNGFEAPGIGREGIPLACDQVMGRAVLGLRGAQTRPMILGIVDVRGSHGSGGFRSSGTIVSADPTTLTPKYQMPDLDLSIEVAHRALDDELAKALDGMPGTNWIWSTFQPKGGFCGASVKLRARPELEGLTALLDIHAADTDLRWSGLPVGLHVDDFDLGLRWSARMGVGPRGWPWRAAGGRFHARGTSASVEGLEVTGVVRSMSDSGPAEITGIESMHFVRVTAPGLALRGRDWDELVAALPELAEVGAELGAKGRVDLSWVDGSVAPGGGREMSMEVTPTLVELLPSGFPMVTSDLTGRLTMSGRKARATPSSLEEPAVLPPPTGAYRGTFAGLWANDMRVAANLELPLDPDLTGVLHFTAGGLDPSNASLLGALSSQSRAGDDGAALTAEGLDLDGRVDLGGSLKLGAGKTETRPDLEVFLRDNTFRTDGLELRDLFGVLTISDGALIGPFVEATLSGTPVELRDARFAFDPARRDGATFFSTKVSAKGLPFDRPHLAAFLEPETLDGLFEQFDWRGNLDLDELYLGLNREPDGRLSVKLSGQLVPQDMHLVFGAPIEVTRAEVELAEFVLEGGRARAWGQVNGLSGALGGRSIHSGELLFSYVDQRLTIQGLDGDFAGGNLSSLGGGSATALAVDLAPPYHFSLGVELKGVDAGALFAGAFGGSGENQGKIDAAARFEATPDDILAASGAGWVRIREARLWSIPVFRELFTQLGFDATGVFDSMRTNFAIQDGAFELRDMTAHSPLLKLVGAGRLDMNGDLGADFEVRYGLIDKLGPLRFFVYWFQNSLLRVEVRGDLHRPLVLLRNSFFDIFKRNKQKRPRLPLPYAAPLPPRF